MERSPSAADSNQHQEDDGNKAVAGTEAAICAKAATGRKASVATYVHTDGIVHSPANTRVASTRKNVAAAPGRFRNFRAR